MVPNLMIGFGIDDVQAEYVADIKLRNINKEYILKRIEEVARAGGGDRRPPGHRSNNPPASRSSSWPSSRRCRRVRRPPADGDRL